MRIIYRLQFIFCICILSVVSLYAQQKNSGVIRGIVLDSASKEALQQASVSLVAAEDSSFVSFTVSDGEGAFTFKPVANGNYKVIVSYVGYKTQTLRTNIKENNSDIRLNRVLLVPNQIVLNEVTIEDQNIPVRLKQDTVEYNAQSFKTQENAQVEDLLKKLPGIEISRDGTIKAQGEEVKQILVDGKPFFGDDPKVASRNLPAEIVEKVQVFDRQSEQAAFSGFDDGISEKTINLTIKKDRKRGIFGVNQIGLGTSERYLAKINFNRFNNGQQLSLIGLANNINEQAFTMRDMFSFGSMLPGASGGLGSGESGNMMMGSMAGLGRRGGNASSVKSNNITEALAGGINFRDMWGKKADISTSYFLNSPNITTNQQSRRTNVLPDSTYVTESENGSTSKILSHRINAHINYVIDSFNSIRLTPNLSINSSEFSNIASSKSITESGILINSSTNTNNYSGEGFTGSNTLLYMRKFRKSGRTLSLNLLSSMNYKDTDGLNKSENLFYNEAEMVKDSSFTDQKSLVNTREFSNNANLSYTEPLSLKNTMELHYSYGQSNNTSEREVINYNESTEEYDEVNYDLTNNFESKFITEKAGVNFQTKRIKYTFTVGADVQKSSLSSINKTEDSELQKSFYNMLPSARLTYNLSGNRKLRINYLTTVNSPSVTQLQPVIDNADPLNVKLGNPELLPENNHSIVALLNKFDPSNFKSLFSMVSITKTANKIVDDVEISPKGTRTSKPVNYDGYYNIRAFLALGRPVGGDNGNVNLTSNAQYNRGIGIINKEQNISNSYTLSQGASLNFYPTDDLELTLSGNINFQNADYSLQENQNSSFFTHDYTSQVVYNLPYKLQIQSDVTYNLNTGSTSDYNQQYVLWNAAITKYLFKNNQGELKAQIFDILRQNRSIERNVGDTYTEDVKSKILQQYFMVSFSYRIRKFGTKM